MYSNYAISYPMKVFYVLTGSGWKQKMWPLQLDPCLSTYGSISDKKTPSIWNDETWNKMQ